MFQFVWNCLMLLLFLGALKAALSLRWPTIGEWRYDDLHPSLRYRDSSSALKLLVNLVFFLVYPGVLLWRWYHSAEWTDWTDVEAEMFEQHVELGEDELLRRGALRGRMIIQKEILLSPAGEEAVHPARFTAGAEDELDSAENELTGDEELPLNLSKGNENRSPECAARTGISRSEVKRSYGLATEECNCDGEDADDDEVRSDGEEVALIVPSSKASPA